MLRKKGWITALVLAGVSVLTWAALHRFSPGWFDRADAAHRGPAVPMTSPGGRGQAQDPLARLMAANRVDGVGAPAAVAQGNGRGTYIVVLADAPVASYRGELRGIPAPRMPKRGTGPARMDMRSDGALKYASYLQTRQVAFERTASGMVGRRIGVRARMQHAISAVVMDLSAVEVARVARLPGVRFVEPYREHPVASDPGPALIGAPALWINTSPFVPSSYQGEGIVIGVIDSGINFGSPSFAAVAPPTGYTHVNPLGSGTFLGTCAPGGVDAGRCNAKLIGGHDFVCGAPTNACGKANVREEPGFGDTHSHGTHVASVVAGNLRDVAFAGRTYRISGVAPRANLIAYDACYTDTTTGAAVCPNSATVVAINQAVADGVDVINYSIGGGIEPWQEATSLAFLAATDAGIYVAASAGNGGPGDYTVQHHEPWVASTVSVQHGLGGLATQLIVTGPQPVFASLTNVYLKTSNGGVPFTASIPGTTPLRLSPGINTGSDGCAAYPANTFAGAIAVLKVGLCSLSIKANNAAAAGAVAVIIGSTGSFHPVVSGTTVPVFGADQFFVDTLGIFTSRVRPAVVTASIVAPQVREPNDPDVLEYSNARGPAGDLALVKPDLAAPGVDVLAAIAGTQLTGSESLVGLMSGTSMATAHHAGAAALLRQAHPTWTPMELRSALQMTAMLASSPGMQPAPTLTGSGRIRLDRAVRAGLVMDETRANFLAADPNLGGRPDTLNLPALLNADCWRTCTFRRTFRNPTASGILWRASVAFGAGFVSPALAWIPPGGTQTFTITIDPSSILSVGPGRLAATRVDFEHRVTGGGVDAFRTLQLPVLVGYGTYGLALTNTRGVTPNGSGGFTAAVEVKNVGGLSLDWTHVPDGEGTIAWASNPARIARSGLGSSAYSNPLQADPAGMGQFAADDFVLSSPARIYTLEVQGFLPGTTLSIPNAATAFTWSIFPDADNDGRPDGHPLTGGAIWSRTVGPFELGMLHIDGRVGYILPNAGVTLDLPAGRYFLVMHTTGTFANRFVQYASRTSSGRPGFATLSVAPDGSGTWVASTAYAGLAMSVTSRVPCGAPWIVDVQPAQGYLDRDDAESLLVGVNPAGLASGEYVGAVCISRRIWPPSSTAVPIRLSIF